MAQSPEEPKARVEAADLWPKSANGDRCDNCTFYRELREGIGYCAHRDVDMVVADRGGASSGSPDRATQEVRRQA